MIRIPFLKHEACSLRRSFAARSGFLLLLLLAGGSPARPDAGTIVPRDKPDPDPAILSLEEMQVDITVDNGDAHIHIVQIFANHTAKMEEGTYSFALPSGSTVSDFAVWDGPVRIPAVILERKRAEQIYAQAAAQAIDPGLLGAGERDGDAGSNALFTAKIAPIPAYGTKRLELDYHQRLSVTAFRQQIVLPLKPDGEAHQKLKNFRLHFALESAAAFSKLKVGDFSGLSFTTGDPHRTESNFQALNFDLNQNFQAAWELAPEGADKLEITTHRDPRTPLPQPGEIVVGKGSKANPPEPGFFEAQLLLADPKPTAAAPSAGTSAGPSAASRTVLLLFDTSLSMQWEKLERSYAALEATLRSLGPADRFNVLLFNSSVTPFKPQPIAADPAAIQQALDFVRASKLRGGTNLLRALTAGLAQVTGVPSAENMTLVLLSDGGSDRGETVVAGKIGARYAALWKAAPHPPHTAVFAVGDDANLPLLRALAHQGGFLEPVLSSEPIDFHLESFLAKLTRTPVAGLALASPAPTRLVYPLDDAVYPGSIAQWVGQYTSVDTPVAFTASGSRDHTPLTASAQHALPALDLSHAQLPRLWAQARVDALLAQIDSEGESASLIAEIIRLSRRYKFVTPYTSFLAVPRSLLRPRVIRPGDPVLRVRTDTEITSVIALFPFGLTKPLRHLASEDLKTPPHGQAEEANRLWETRFLAPPDMRDGTYAVRLILRDTHGNTYNERKTFVIASTPPTVKLALARPALHRGETLEIRAAASQSTRTLTARLEGVRPVPLRWNPRAQTNTGTLVLPPDLPIGRYRLVVTAEDVAHNLGSQEVQIDVLP